MERSVVRTENWFFPWWRSIVTLKDFFLRIQPAFSSNRPPTPIPFFTTGTLSKETLIRFGLIRTPEWPSAQRILPQLASSPKKAVLTNGEWATAYAARLASSLFLAPWIRISINLVAPSPSLTRLLSSRIYQADE